MYYNAQKQGMLNGSSVIRQNDVSAEFDLDPCGDPIQFFLVEPMLFQNAKHVFDAAEVDVGNRFRHKTHLHMNKDGTTFPATLKSGPVTDCMVSHAIGHPADRRGKQGQTVPAPRLIQHRTAPQITCCSLWYYPVVFLFVLSFLPKPFLPLPFSAA